MKRLTKQADKLFESLNGIVKLQLAAEVQATYNPTKENIEAAERLDKMFDQLHKVYSAVHCKIFLISGVLSDERLN